MFMVSVHEGPERRVPLHRSFIDAATRAELRRSSTSRFSTRGSRRVFCTPARTAPPEQVLAESGVPYTSIRNGMYADDIPGWFDPDGIAARARRRRPAELLVPARARPGDRGHAHRARSRGTALRHRHAAAGQPRRARTDGVGCDRKAVPLRADRRRRLGHALARARKRSGWELEAGHTSFDALRSGELDVVSDDFRRITGTEPLSVADVIGRHADELPL